MNLPVVEPPTDDWTDDRAVRMKNVIYWVADKRFLALAIGNARRLAPTIRPDTSLHIFLEDEHARSFETGPIKVHANVLTPFLKGSNWPADWPKIVWGHLFALGLMGPEVEKALYIDSDAFPLQPINALFDVDLEGKAVAAVADAGFLDQGLRYAKHDFAGHARDAGVDTAHYFNAGLVMFDRRAIAGIDFAAEISRYLDRYGPKATYCNQDFLNHLFQGRWQELSPLWNFQAGALLGYGLENVIRPNIIHFTDSHRPWHGKEFIHDEIHARRALALIDNEFRADFGLKPKNASALRSFRTGFTVWRNVVLLALGIRYKRVRRQGEIWGARRDILWPHFTNAFAEGRYADIRQSLTQVDFSGAVAAKGRKPVWNRTGYTIPSELRYDL